MKFSQSSLFQMRVCPIYQQLKILLWLLEQNVNHLLKTRGNRLLLTKSTLSSRILLSNFSTLSFKSKGLEWQFQGWKLIIFRPFFAKQSKYAIWGIEIMYPNQICLINVWTKNCVDSLQCVNTGKKFTPFNFTTISLIWSFQFRLIPRYFNRQWGIEFLPTQFNFLINIYNFSVLKT